MNVNIDDFLSIFRAIIMKVRIFAMSKETEQKAIEPKCHQYFLS